MLLFSRSYVFSSYFQNQVLSKAPIFRTLFLSLVINKKIDVAPVKLTENVINAKPKKMVSIVNENGDFIETVTIGKAVYKARQSNMKMVLIEPHADPYPIYKIMTSQQLTEERFKIHKEKIDLKKLEGQKLQINVSIKNQDLNSKIKQILTWLKNGYSIRLTIIGEIGAEEVMDNLIGKIKESIKENGILNITNQSKLETKLKIQPSHYSE